MLSSWFWSRRSLLPNTKFDSEKDRINLRLFRCQFVHLPVVQFEFLGHFLVIAKHNQRRMRFKIL